MWTPDAPTGRYDETMKFFVGTVIVSAMAGCTVGYVDECDDGPGAFVVVSGLDMAQDGTVSVAISRQRVDDGGCEVTSRTGVLNVIAPDATTATLLRLPTQTGDLATIGSTTYALAGQWGSAWGILSGPGATRDLYSLDLDAPNLGTKLLPEYGTELIPVAGRLAIPLTPPSVLIDDVQLAVPGMQAITAYGGRLWAATSDGVAEIDPVSATEIGRRPACAAHALTGVGSRTLLLACDPAGLATLDVVDGTFAVLDTAQNVATLRGTSTSTIAFVEIAQADPYSNYTRSFVLGTGLTADAVGAPRSGPLLDVAFTPAGAFVAMGYRYGDLAFVANDGSATWVLPESGAIARAVIAPDGLLTLVAFHPDLDGLGVLWIDPMSHETVRGPIPLRY